MKTIIYLMITILLFTSCNKKQNFTITVEGHLKDSDIKEITLISNILSYKAPVDSTGNFIFEITNDQARVYQISHPGKLKLFLIPGDTLSINETDKGYSYTGGQSAVLSNYYIEWKEYWDKLTDTVNIEKYYSQESEKFKQSVHQYLELSEAPLDSLVNKNQNIDPEFVRLEKESLKYYMYWDLLNYEINYRRYKGNSPTVPESFDNFMDQVNLNDSTMLQLENYKDFLVSYAYKVMARELAENADQIEDDFSETAFILGSLPNEFSDGHCRDYVLYQVIYDRTQLLQINEDNLSQFKKLCRRQDFVQKVEDKYQDLKFLMTGNPAPEFTFIDKKDNVYHLSDFKGKYLLIDVWGAYCGPCKREMPYLSQIEKEYKEKNFEFVGVCFEKDKEVWLKRIDEYKLEGLQLTVVDGWDSQFRKDYRIPWVPTYILIDKDGIIIHARAPKPSEDLRDLLDKTLKNEI